MRSIYHKLLTLVNIIKLYKTWHLAVLDRYNLLSGLVKHTLRDGTVYLTRAKKEDAGTINSIYIWKDYDEHLDKIKYNSVVIDVGAHIGVFSIFVQKLTKCAAVYSYEPHAETFQLLQENIRLNNMADKTHASNLGISGASELRKLFLNEINPGANSMIYKTEKFIEIKTISLKDVFDKNNLSRCDFLKMDCEGMEYEILYATPKEYMAKIKSISIEYHDNGDINKLTNFLNDDGFETNFKNGKNNLLYAKRNEL